MNRRGFLNGVLAACAAPAVVRAGSLMKIVVPSTDLVVPSLALLDFEEFAKAAFTEFKVVSSSIILPPHHASLLHALCAAYAPEQYVDAIFENKRIKALQA